MSTLSAISILSLIAAALGICTPQSAPNPIASTFPNSATGTINATISVLPVPYAVARAIIPANYAILPGYTSFLSGTGFPNGAYPIVLETTIDHDVQSSGIRIPDFSSAHFSFPFVDLLGDGYSNFRYSPGIILSNNPVAISGAAAYGEQIVPSTFDPPCDPYSYSEGSKDIYFKAYPVGSSKPSVSVRFATLSSQGPYPLAFYINATNQPMFASGDTCDNMIRFFNTTISTGDRAPVGVHGNVTAQVPSLAGTSSFEGVYGIKVDTAFIENNYLPCNSLKGYGS